MLSVVILLLRHGAVAHRLHVFAVLVGGGGEVGGYPAGGHPVEPLHGAVVAFLHGLVEDIHVGEPDDVPEGDVLDDFQQEGVAVGAGGGKGGVGVVTSRQVAPRLLDGGVDGHVQDGDVIFHNLLQLVAVGHGSEFFFGYEHG